MPVHDWTRISPGGFHTFHQDWTIELYRALNRGLLPAGYAAFTDLKVETYEPDVVAIGTGGPPPPAGGVGVADAPPRARQIIRAETESAAYARKANRISVRHEFGTVVAIIEVVSPGNKDTRHAARSFVRKAVDFLRLGVHFLMVDLFPPTPRDPDGLHRLIWNELATTPFEPRAVDKPLTVASFDAWDGLTAYIDPLAVGDPLPDAPLFIAPGRHVNVPLERTYQASWAEMPPLVRDRVQTPADSTPP